MFSFSAAVDFFTLANHGIPGSHTRPFHKKLAPNLTTNRPTVPPRQSQTRLSERYLDFPIVNRKVSCAEHRYVWASTGCSKDGVAPVQGFIKVDTTDPTAEQVSEENSYHHSPHWSQSTLISVTYLTGITGAP